MTAGDARVVLIYGPTASGKSALALEIAARENGVVINADSMQIYDALPILTAQPSAAEQQSIPHLLYGAVPAAEKFSAARWQERAMAEIRAVLTAGQTPIICGGTGLYFKTLLHGLSPIPDVPPEIRRMAIELQSELGNPTFHGALAQKDPEMARRLNPNDTQRLIRAWEVFAATGKSLAYWQSLPQQGPPADWRFEHHFVNPGRDEIRARCDRRFEAMLADGALAEVEKLDSEIAAGRVPPDAGIIVAHGFRPLRAHLHGLLSLEDAAWQAKQETRQYAKRQVTWFRHQLQG